MQVLDMAQSDSTRIMQSRKTIHFERMRQCKVEKEHAMSKGDTAIIESLRIEWPEV